MRPRVHRRPRAGSIGPIPGVTGILPVPDLLDPATYRRLGTRFQRPTLGPRLPRRLDLVLVVGPSAGGPDRLTGPVTDVFLACERRMLQTVLFAGAITDLETPVAAICRAIVSHDNAVVDQAERWFGADRARLLPAPDQPLRAWLDAVLPGRK